MLDVSNEIHLIASTYLKNIRQSGSENIMAICPFHRKPDGREERRPSFSMNTYTGVYFCHTCQAAGTLRQFLIDVGMPREYVHLRYQDLLDAARSNLPPPPDPTKPGVFEMEPISEGLLGLFDGYDLQDLKAAGFSEETIQHFELGYDRWHERVTYPVRDIKGDLVAISGRSLGDEWPKYKIYEKEYQEWGLPPRLGWDKRKALYNAGEVYPAAINRPPTDFDVVVVEGFKACMWLWQAGIRNVVALLGSYMSWEQRWIMERLGGRIHLFLDNNFAGLKGTLKAGEALLSQDVRVIEYPERVRADENAQPDSCTATEVHEQMAIAPPYLEWLRRQSEGA